MRATLTKQNLQRKLEWTIKPKGPLAVTFLLFRVYLLKFYFFPTAPLTEGVIMQTQRKLNIFIFKS